MFDEKQKNYYQRFKEQEKKSDEKFLTYKKKPALLLHACCCPCSSHCLSVLVDHFDVTVYFYNPNIDRQEEYDKRYLELVRFLKEADFTENVKIVNGEYEPEEFNRIAEGRENIPERGERCYLCYEQRMRKTAGYAADNGYDFFSTTLSISPYKNAKWINEIGMKLEKNMSQENEKYPEFLFSDFKKENGYKHSIELSKEYNLYRQNYCGCRFSKRDHEEKLKAFANSSGN